MKILGIDSSGNVASAALTVDGILVCEFTVNNGQTHSQTLLPMIDNVFKMSDILPEQIDAIAIASGPGSFTGLRIGSSTAKGLGMALKKPLISVPTLEGLAYRLAGCEGYVCPMMDARRNQVYTGVYKVYASGLDVVLEQRATDVREIVEDLRKLDGHIFFLGDGVKVLMDVYSGGAEIVSKYSVAPLHLNRQSAASVAALGEIYFNMGRYETAAGHVPTYMRKSQAEREREERRKDAINQKSG